MHITLLYIHTPADKVHTGPLLLAGSGRKVDEEDDLVAFVGSPWFTRNAEMKSSGQGLYLDTNLVRASVPREAQDVHADNGFQRQVAVVTVRVREKNNRMRHVSYGKEHRSVFHYGR